MRVFAGTLSTPGPWYWHTDALTGRVSLRTPDRGQLIVMDCARRGMHGAAPRFAVWPYLNIGQPRGRLGGILEDFDGDHPDARVIVAAPVLLAALEEARNGLKWYQDTYPVAVSGCDDEAMARIDAALTQATGVAP